MKHRKQLPFIALALLAQTACTPGEIMNEQTGTGATDGAALCISSLELAEKAEVNTRAFTIYDQTKNVGFFVQENTENGYTAVDNSKGAYNIDKGAWIATTDLFLSSKKAKIAVCAPYHAANNTAGNPGTLNLVAGELGKTNTAIAGNTIATTELWCGSAEVSRADMPVNKMELKQLYTRLILKISKDATYTTDAEITQIDVQNPLIFQKALYNVFTAAYTGSDVNAVVQSTQTLKTTEITYDMLLVPTDVFAGSVNEYIKLVFTINGKKMTKEIKAETLTGGSGSNIKLAAGKQYTVSLKLQPSALNLTGVAIADWDVKAIGGTFDVVV